MVSTKTMAVTSVVALSSCYYLFWYRKKKRRRLIEKRRRVLVIGAASGIGKATVKYLVSRGDFVYAADVHRQGVIELAKELNHQDYNNCSVLPLPFDVRKFDQVSNAAKLLKAYFGSNCLDAIVNIAGVIHGGPLVEMDATDFQLVMDVNITGMFHVNKAFFPLLERTPQFSHYSRHDNKLLTPRIINVNSEVGRSGLSVAFHAPYAMSKVAVESYSVALRQELGLLKDGSIDVTVINPGAMDTEMVDRQLKGSNGYIERAADKPGTLFRSQMLKAVPPAQAYMKRHMTDPILCAEAIYKAVHAATPYRRHCPNMSWEMTLAGYTPQWILDVVLAKQLESSSSAEEGSWCLVLEGIVKLSNLMTLLAMKIVLPSQLGPRFLFKQDILLDTSQRSGDRDTPTLKKIR